MRKQEAGSRNEERASGARGATPRTFIAWIAGCSETAQEIEMEADQDDEFDCPACEYANSYVFAADEVEFDVATDDQKVKTIHKVGLGPFCAHFCANKDPSAVREKRTVAPTFTDIVMAPWKQKDGSMHTVSFLDGEPFSVSWGDTEKGPIFIAPWAMLNTVTQCADTEEAGEVALSMAKRFWISKS